ncbi:type II secretion system secretin GspD [Candidatus Marithrix sp. Canyon 246]|uniref:type II secretion system secretin GspD n=1 Tax=Candidatus Marithrix sp. Canyon 246 TaxID=1827136 RepID=UPI00084A243A|nr:type II secretion system secretin GspD [Candidatus Marithrix sp. Canyon 246]
MYCNLEKQIIVVLLSSSILLACTARPQQPQPQKSRVSAEELAMFDAAVVTKTPRTQPLIAELPTSQPQSLLGINQKGQLPIVTTITEHNINLPDIDLSDDDPINLDFDQVALRQVLQILSDALGIGIIIDPKITEKVTIRTAKDKPLTKKDLWPLLQMLLRDAEITMERKGNVYYVKKTKPEHLPDTVGMIPETLTATSFEEVMQVTPLRYITADAVKNVIDPLLKPKGRIVALPGLNFIGIVTTPARLKRINKLIKVIDADPFLHRGMRLFRLYNSKATEVQAELDKILKAMSGNTKSTYQVIALERVNALLVVAPPRSGFSKVASWVQILDERTPDITQQLFVYKVKNLEAKKLQTTLSAAFKITDKKAAEEKRQRELRQQQNQTAITNPPLAPPGYGLLPVSAELDITIVADEATNSLLIRATAKEYRQLLETIAVLDQIPKEVLINVVIAEVGLSEVNKFGIDWSYMFGGNAREGSGDTVQRSYIGTEFKVGSASGLVLNHLAGSINALLNVISTHNQTRILSRPSLLVRNNEEASINVGANEPYLGDLTTGAVGVQPTQSVQYKDVGITVKVTPRINDDGIINMKIYQELSQLGDLRTEKQLQSFIQRKIETHVVVRDRSAIIIGGLIETINKDNKQSIPGLRDIPVIGDKVFSTSDLDNKRTELVLIIVPQIVDPAVDNSPIIQNFKRQMKKIAKLLNNEYVFVGEIADLPQQRKNN